MSAPDTAQAADGRVMPAPPSTGNWAEDGSIIPPLTASRRSDGWTPQRQRAFLEFVAAGNTVATACLALGMSVQSAYAFRARAAGAAFAIGWHAATLIQRQKISDALSARALEGQTVTITKDDGTTVTRHHFDNRLGLQMLARADKLASGETPDRFGEAQAARLAACEWERYLDLIGDAAGPARTGLFLALRREDGDEPEGLAAVTRLARADCYQRTGAGLVAEVQTDDLDLAQRASWTAEQWARAEAAGLLQLAAPQLQPEPEAQPEADAEAIKGEPEGDAATLQLHQHSRPSRYDASDAPVWWCPTANEWRTHFPPPAGFDGEEGDDYGAPDYQRELSDEELDLVEAAVEEDEAALRSADAPDRDAWFAALAGPHAADG